MSPLGPLLGALLAAGAAWPAGFSREDGGTTTAQFLELPVGARAASMGSAQGAAVDDASALHYNPACLASVRGGSALLTHAAYLQGIGYRYGAAAQRLGSSGTLGLGVTSLSTPAIPELDNRGLATGSTLSPGDLSIAAGFGRAVGSLDLGAGVKLISSEIQNSARTWAADLGARLRLGPAAVSGSVANLGTGLKFRERRDPLPLTFRLGSSVRRGDWLLATDVVLPQGTEPLLAAGIERSLLLSGVRSFLRAGFDGRAARAALGEAAGLALGAGIKAGSLGVDYSWSPMGSLGAVHRFSVAFAWAAPAKPAPPAPASAIHQP